MSTAVILGAGYSFVGGLPLAASILDSASIFVGSESASERHTSAVIAWQEFKKQNPEKTAEQFLGSC